MKFVLSLLVALFLITWRGHVSAQPLPPGAECRGAQPPSLTTRNWCHVDGPNVRVWWVKDAPGQANKAFLVRDAVTNHIWPLFKTILKRVPVSDDNPSYILNGGSGHYDVILEPGQVAEKYGDTLPVSSQVHEFGGPARFSRAKASLDDRMLVNVVAHELMHAFLFSFNCSGDCYWIREAFATLSQHIAYPEHQSEHEYAPDFLRQHSLSLDTTGLNLHQYGAYLLPFSIQYRDGRATKDDLDWIRQFWEETERVGPYLALDIVLRKLGLDGMEGFWSTFVTNNWNEEPAGEIRNGKRLTNGPGFYAALDSLGSNIARTPDRGDRDVQVDDSGEFDGKMELVGKPLPISLPHLSAAYFSYQFRDDNARSVVLAHNLRGVLENGQRGAQVIVFAKVRGRDWTVERVKDDERWRFFCRDKADERLERLVVILANASVDKDRSVDWNVDGRVPSVTATNIGCHQYRGHLSVVTVTPLDPGNVRVVASASDVLLRLVPAMADAELQRMPVPFNALRYALDGPVKVRWQAEGKRKRCVIRQAGNYEYRLENTGLRQIDGVIHPFQLLNDPESRVYHWQIPSFSAPVKRGVADRIPSFKACRTEVGITWGVLGQTQTHGADAPLVSDVGLLSGESVDEGTTFRWALEPISEP
jgi:hypothetical protein